MGLDPWVDLRLQQAWKAHRQCVRSVVQREGPSRMPEPFWFLSLEDARVKCEAWRRADLLKMSAAWLGFLRLLPLVVKFWQNLNR